MSDQSWTRTRLEGMIQQRIEENIHLDYKAAAALDRKYRTEITKDVSAFANSDGGTIVYGMKEFQDAALEHLPESIDPIDGREYTREWLEHIAGQISPRIEGLRIFPVRVGPEEWHTCYAVEIPKGETAHQAKDFRYYRRYNFESVPMEDHEIRDVMNRRKHPRLAFKIRLIQTQDLKLKVITFVRNSGHVIPKRYSIEIFLPNFVRGKVYMKGAMKRQIDGKSFWRIIAPGIEPAYPGFDAYSAFELDYQVDTLQRPDEEPHDQMICTLYADEMPPVKRNVPVAAALSEWV